MKAEIAGEVLEELIRKALETGREEDFEAMSGYLEQMDPDSAYDFEELKECIASYDLYELYHGLYSKYADRMSSNEYRKYREDYLRLFEDTGLFPEYE